MRGKYSNQAEKLTDGQKENFNPKTMPLIALAANLYYGLSPRARSHLADQA